MQQRQYRVSTRVTVFFWVAGAVQLTGGGVSIVLQPNVVGDSYMILLGALFTAVALRPGTVTVDDGGLHLCTLIRNRVIPWSLVRSFRTQPGGTGGRGWWSVWVELGAGKKVLLRGALGSKDRAMRIAAELTAMHREYLAGASARPGWHLAPRNCRASPE